MKNIFLIILTSLALNFVAAQENNTPAIFPGGDAAWSHYLDTAFNIHQMAKQMTKKDFERFGKIQQVTYYYFIMENGSIDLIKIEGIASQAVRNEIQRVLKTAPRWTPATMNGKPTMFRKKQTTTFTFE